MRLTHLRAEIAALFLIMAAIAWPHRALAGLPEQVVTIGDAQLQAPIHPGDPAILRVPVKIAPGWHINSDHPSNPDYIATELSVTPPAELNVAAVQYPAAETITPAFSPGEKLSVFSGDITLSAPVTKVGHATEEPLRLRLALYYQACDNNRCLRPVKIQTSAALQWPTSENYVASPPPSETNPSPATNDNIFTRHGFGVGFLLVLLGGLALNLTPCVYPLIGVTIAYFGNQPGGGTRRVLILSILYVIGIALMFSAIGTAAALSGGLFGALLEKPIVIGAIALLMLILAASSFGWFSLQPPSWLLQRAGTARPGYFGAIGMGLGMGVVAAPCIGPFVLGLLIVVEHSRNALFGLAVFFVLALGMGAPYVLLALAVGRIRHLPRSGEWLAWMEHLFGFILVGLALYFIDPLVPNRMATRFLPYYGAAVGFYLGFVSPVGRKLRGFGLFRTAVGVASLVALVYLMIPAAPRPEPLSFARYTPAQLTAASAEHKPVIIDFAADWCIPCREMEATTFAAPSVIKEAQRFVALRADLTADDSANGMLARQFQIQGVPTIVLIDDQGKLVKRTVGYVGPGEFLELLKTVSNHS